MPTAKYTKKRIIETAHTLFTKQGVESTTMIQIAETMGISRRTIYTYYKDKQALLLAVIEQELERMTHSLSQVLTRRTDAVTKLLDLLDSHLRIVQEAVQRQGVHNEAFFSDTFEIERLRLKHDQSEYDMIKRILQEGCARGEVDVPDIASMAYLLLKTFKSLEAPYINRYHHEYGKSDYQKIIRSVELLLRSGLRTN